MRYNSRLCLTHSFALAISVDLLELLHTLHWMRPLNSVHGRLVPLHTSPSRAPCACTPDQAMGDTKRHLRLWL
jgi:hypothetical protein